MARTLRGLLIRAGGARYLLTLKDNEIQGVA